MRHLKPSGKYVFEDLHNIGGTPALMKYLLEKGLLDGSCMTVTGHTLAENLRDLPASRKGKTWCGRSKSRSSPAVTSASCAATWPRPGAVAKITGKEGLVFSGTAKVYDSEEEMLAALEEKKIEKET